MQLTNLQLTRNNKSIPEISRTNPAMAGIPKIALSKYVPLLLDADMTVVLVVQQVEEESSQSSSQSSSSQSLLPPKNGKERVVAEVVTKATAAASALLSGGGWGCGEIGFRADDENVLMVVDYDGRIDAAGWATINVATGGVQVGEAHGRTDIASVLRCRGRPSLSHVCCRGSSLARLVV